MDWRDIPETDLDVIHDFLLATDVPSLALQKIGLEMWSKEKGCHARAIKRASNAEAEVASAQAKGRENAKAQLAVARTRFKQVERELKRKRDKALGQLQKATEEIKKLEGNAKRAKTWYTKAQKEKNEKIKSLEKQLGL